MASQGLPENWEWDFDGKRWFYRYKPTGLIQYTWPKPGDEFPDFVEDGAPPPDLAPEEMLISQKQRRRSTLDNDPSKPKRKENKQSFIIEEDDGPGEYWDQPDALMYMGPGAYNDISPLQEDDDIRQDDARADEKPSPFTAGASPQKATGFQRVTEQFERTHISPLMSAETTPLVPNSQPVIATPEIDRVPVVEANNYAAIAEVSATPAAPVATAVSVEMPAPVEVPAPVEAPAAPVELPPESSAPRSPDVPLLDSRQVPYTPVGFVAELPSELTAQCHEEINPTPVELPGHEIMMESSTEPVIYANAFPLAPAELHSDAMIPSRVEQRRAVEPKTLAFKTPELDGQRRPGQAGTGTHTFNHETPPIPRPAPLRQNSMPQTGHAHSQSLSAVADSSRGQFKPYNPALGAVTEGSDQNSYAPSAYVSASESHIPGLSVGNKRHSLAATPSSSWKPSDVPAALKPFKAWKPLPPTQEGATAGHEVQDDNMSAPARFPSVLQPARGRPNITQTPPPIQSPPPVQSPPPNQRVDANQRYQAYKPVGSIHQNLQRDIDSTLNELSKTTSAYYQVSQEAASAASSDPGRPTLARASTIPVDLPALPYMGVRPQMPPSTASAPVALQNKPFTQPFAPPQHTASMPLGVDANNKDFQAYHAPLPPSSPDIPPPLKIARNKSPPPVVQNHLPTVASSLRPPISIEEYVVSRETTPAPGEYAAPTPTTVGYDEQGPDGNFHQQPSSSNPAKATPPPYKLPGFSFEAPTRNEEALPTQSKPLEINAPAVGDKSGSSAQPTAPLGTQSAVLQSEFATQNPSAGPATVFSSDTAAVNSGPITQFSDTEVGQKHQVAPHESSLDKSQTNQSIHVQSLSSPPQVGAGQQQIGPQSLMFVRPSAPGTDSNSSFQARASGAVGYIRPQTPPRQSDLLSGQRFVAGNPPISQVSPPDRVDLNSSSSFSSPSIDAGVNMEAPPPRPPKTPHNEPSPVSPPAKSTHGGQQTSSNTPPVPSMPPSFQGHGSFSPPVTSPPSQTTGYYPAAYAPPSTSHGPSSPPPTMNTSQNQPMGVSGPTTTGQQQLADDHSQKPYVNAPSAHGQFFVPPNPHLQGGPSEQPPQAMTAGASTASYQPMPPRFGHSPPPNSMVSQFRPQSVTGYVPSSQKPSPPGVNQFQRPGGSLPPHIYSPMGLSPSQPPPMPTPPGQTPGSLPQRASTFQNPGQQTLQTHSSQLSHSGITGNSLPQGQNISTPPNFAGPTNLNSGSVAGQQLQAGQQMPHTQLAMQQQQFVQQRPPMQQHPPVKQQPSMQHLPTQQHPQFQQGSPPAHQRMQHPQQRLQQRPPMPQQAGSHQGPPSLIPPQNQGPDISPPLQTTTVPAQQDKGWLGGIGKLWRNGSLRKESPAGGSPLNSANKLQKPPPQVNPQQVHMSAQISALAGNPGQPVFPGVPPMQQSPGGRQPGHIIQFPSQQQQFLHQHPQQQQQQQQGGMLGHGRNSSLGVPVQGGLSNSQQGAGSGKSSRVSSYSGSINGPRTQTQSQTTTANNNGWGNSTSYDGDGWGDGYD